MIWEFRSDNHSKLEDTFLNGKKGAPQKMGGEKEEVDYEPFDIF